MTLAIASYPLSEFPLKTPSLPASEGRLGSRVVALAHDANAGGSQTLQKVFALVMVVLLMVQVVLITCIAFEKHIAIGLVLLLPAAKIVYHLAMNFLRGWNSEEPKPSNIKPTFDALKATSQFQLEQVSNRRLFKWSDATQTLGTVYSSDYGFLDFYDHQNIKQWTGDHDVLLDAQEKWAGIAINETDGMGVFSKTRERLAYFDREQVSEETGESFFVFRDAETHLPLAYAYWAWSPPKTWHNEWVVQHETTHQAWSLKIMDEARLREKDISSTHLAWVLLKHTQRNLLGPDNLPYEQGP